MARAPHNERVPDLDYWPHPSMVVGPIKEHALDIAATANNDLACRPSLVPVAD